MVSNYTSIEYRHKIAGSAVALSPVNENSSDPLFPPSPRYPLFIPSPSDITFLCKGPDTIALEIIERPRRPPRRAPPGPDTAVRRRRGGRSARGRAKAQRSSRLGSLVQIARVPPFYGLR
ncbi:hypothetical protein EVAR_51568_1 [Eumeta japonica]|uniref:Uncharacterized protein n=1 Tax=Eumeta variegata TaxID=151549 RepID=A0A4C1Z5S8_EUMVA|nr:hypothetical protein EVAR_51568_1 [Eumeta japonica]